MYYRSLYYIELCKRLDIRDNLPPVVRQNKDFLEEYLPVSPVPRNNRAQERGMGFKLKMGRHWQ